MGRDRARAADVTAGSSVQRLASLTDAIQSAMDAGDWKQAATLAETRLETLRMLFAPGGAAGLDAELFEKLLLDAQATNFRLIGEVDHHRRRLRREAELETSAERAVEHYAATARDT